MFNLNRAIADWRVRMERSPALHAAEVDELEAHLWDEVDRLMGQGLGEREAFVQATTRLGGANVLAFEYEQGKWGVGEPSSSPWQHTIWILTMLKSYALIALRNLRKHKGYAFINIVGLAVGMACCLLIVLFVQDEQSYDTHHEKGERIYRVVLELTMPGQEQREKVVLPYRISELLEGNVAQIEQTARITRQQHLFTYQDQSFTESGFAMADASILDIFTFNFVRGNPETALDDPYAVLLTESTARKYFGETDPIGQILTMDEQHNFTVTGIIEDLPKTTHMPLDMLASLANVEQRYNDEMLNSPGAQWVYTYVLLPEGTTNDMLAADINAVVQPLTPPGFELGLSLQPMLDIHLHSQMPDEWAPTSNIIYVYAFLVIAVFILAIACINFMNLSTARSAWRAKEVGVRKVVGANRSSLIRQFLGESLLLSLLGAALALLLMEAFVPIFNAITGQDLVVDYANNQWVLGALFGIALVVGVLSGSYPAFYLSAFRPVQVLKGGLQAQGRGAAALRKTLVVFQFAISIFLIIGTVVVYSQLRYVQDKNLGFDTEQIVAVHLPDRDVRQSYASLKQTYEQHPNVVRVSAASDAPPGGLNSWRVRPEGTPREQDELIPVVAVDYDYMETLGLELIEGRAFSEDLPTDASEAIILNEAAARRLGIENLEATRFTMNNKPGVAIGIVRDYHYQSLHSEIAPIMLTIWEPWYDQLIVKISPDNVQETLAFLEREWDARSSAWPFTYSFLDDRVDAMYRTEQRLGTSLQTFAFLSIFIACLGLFGLAAFMAEQRTKEIGIRKALGASSGHIVALFSNAFVRLVLVAFVVAAPLAYVAMDWWLQDFAYRVSIGVGTILLGGGLAILIAMLTVSSQTLRAALTKPVEALRYE